MSRRLYLFYHLSFRRKYLLLLTFCLACWTWLLMKYFKSRAVFGKPDTGYIPGTVDRTIVSDIRFSIFVVSRYAPFENVCRHQAYQALLLCRLYKIPYRIYVGFKINASNKIEGHAWTMVGDEMITGFCKPADYVVQAVYS